MRPPCAAVPLPAGRPVPSGRMLMSHGLMSASVTGWPRFGPCASAGEAASTASARNLRVDMAHLAFRVDRPARDGIAMLIGKTRHREGRRGLASRGDELGARRLRVAGLIPGAALQ